MIFLNLSRSLKTIPKASRNSSSTPIAFCKTVWSVSEIIGEAAGHLPKDLTDRYSDIPWRRITAMRNRLSHEYFGVLLERVWEVIERDLPILKVNIRTMIEDLS